MFRLTPTVTASSSSVRVRASRASKFRPGEPFPEVLQKTSRRIIMNDRGRHAITQVIPSLQGDASTQSPPDLPSFIFKERIVYLGMTLVPSVTELILAELLYLQYEDKKKPIQLYINSTGSSKDGQKYGYDTEAFAIYDTIQYVSPPVHTIAVGTAWGEAAMLLAAGSRGNRAALPSASIMLKQPLSAFRGQVNICICILSVVAILTSIRHLSWKFNARRCEILKDKCWRY